MTVKNAALLALIGTCLATIVLVIAFVDNVLGAAQGLLAPTRVVTSLIYVFAGVSAAVFLLSFQQAQS
jgi:hypothetical protein